MIEMDKGHLATMMEAGYIYLGMRRYDKAKELFDGLCALSPKSEIPIVALGNVEFCEGNIAKAITHYKKALKLDPESDFAKVYMGEALLFLGKRDVAMPFIEDVASLSDGGAGEFANALLEAIRGGFDPITVPKAKKGKGKS